MPAAPRPGEHPRRWRRRLVRTACAALPVPLMLVAALALAAAPAAAAPVTVTNATQFTDTTGAGVHAHGGGMIKVGGYYYWFGENRHDDHTFRYVSVYRSTDLRTWELRNHVLRQSSSPELAVANIERPKILYNPATGRYVLWMHWENGVDYGQARVAVATSDTVDGDYTYLGSFRPLGYDSRDMTVFRDDDGTAYLISSTRVNADLNIYRLTPDYTGVAALVQTLWPGNYREAPAMFKRNGVYFLVTSGATGWQPNQARYATAYSITGTWTAPTTFGDSITYGSQPAYVLPVQGTATTSYLYLGDRWASAWGGRVNESRYVWLPLTFPSNTSLSMSWHPQISIDTATGQVTGVGGGYAYETLRARHSGKCLDVLNESTADGAGVAQYGCHNGGNQHWQLRDLGNGYHQLVARHSDRCLTVSNGSTADHAAVAQYACQPGRTDQQWQLVDAGSGYLRTVARHSGKCLDVAGYSTADSARVIQYTCGTGGNQQWQRVGVS
ncbi:RICIN domain-containing protein [Solwaraspora sp. WMMD937]|uniref:RICIN domain-containing protein n=1 Tax=Solwaraspora sp. WMMD937 TaxID=3016090 RepID=UPI00249BD693|nr:RICIN domain-containing protein [Solwaraspora sp. WMMD937]WFE19663.1 RICIN domain-containing protein [Solwaraspora sp. WMMD937]